MKKVNKYAILGIVFSFINGILGMVISLYALKQISKKKERGKILAVFGLVVGLVWTFLVSIFIASVILNNDNEINIKDKTPILARGTDYIKQLKKITDSKLKDNTFESNRVYIYDMANDFSEAESGYIVVDTKTKEYYVFIYDVNYMIVNKKNIDINSVEILNKKKWNKLAGNKKLVCKSVTGKENICYDVLNNIIE